MLRRRRSSLSISRDKPRRIYQTLAVDEFGELKDRKRESLERARALGHQMTGWHRRTNDPHGRWNSYCVDCNRMAVVATEQPEGLSLAYGNALDENCQAPDDEQEIS